MSSVLSVNIAQHYSDGPSGQTGFDKRPTTETVTVRAPGGKREGLGSGLVGTVFRAMMTEPELLPDILAADALAAEVKRLARKRLAG